MSLSFWLRDYPYIPLGGNRGGTLFVCRNLMITMLLGGLWHGPHGITSFGARCTGPRFALTGHGVRLPRASRSSGRAILAWTIAAVVLTRLWGHGRLGLLSQRERGRGNRGFDSNLRPTTAPYDHMVGDGSHYARHACPGGKCGCELIWQVVERRAGGERRARQKSSAPSIRRFEDDAP